MAPAVYYLEVAAEAAARLLPGSRPGELELRDFRFPRALTLVGQRKTLLTEAEVEGDGVSIAFNARYLTEALQNVVAERVALEFSGPLSPGVLKPTDDPDYVHVIMPVRTPS